MLLPPGDERRANELANLLTGSWRIHDEKNVNLFQVGSHDVNLDSLEEAEWRKISVYAQTTTPLPDSLQIRILPINPAPTGFEWRLNIYNEKDKAIHKWYGHGHPPEQIIWDWKLSDGTFVGTGNYCYYIQWVDEDGVWRRSFRQYFQIKHIRKLHSFDVTQKPKHLDHGVEEFRLILGAGKKKRINDK
ncbi:hypothetical protein H8D57_02725 [bacterium]|nr:hypothetical protein [bacterium]